MKSLKIIVLFIAGLFTLSGQAIAQNCAAYTADTQGSIEINLNSASGECFKFYLKGKQITPDYTNYLTFRANEGIKKVKAVMENGTVVEKSLALSSDQASLVYNLKKNKKGKYSIKMSLGEVELTAEGKAERDARIQKNKDELQARQDAFDAEWEEKKEAREAEKAARKEEEKKLEAQKKADREARYAEQRAAEDKNRTTMSDHLAERAEREEKEKAEKAAAEEKESAASVGEEAPNENVPSSFSKGATEIPMVINYEGKPITNTYVRLEINDVFIGDGLTNEKGQVLIHTDQPLNYDTGYKLTGKKGGYTWSFEGIYALTPLPKASLVNLRSVVKTVAGFMGTTPDQLAASWGLK